jgi:hypothetical protein
MEWESRLDRLIAELPRSKRENDPVFEPSIGYPAEVLAAIEGAGISIQRCKPGWGNVGHLVLQWTEDSFLSWDEVNGEAGEEKLRDALQSAHTKRIASYRRCHTCSSINPPEWMNDRTTCMDCAVRDGVVY